MSRFCLLVFHDGRHDYLRRALASLSRHVVFPERPHRILIDDMPAGREEAELRRIAAQYDFDRLVLHDANVGIEASVQQAWADLPEPTEYVFHLENDFVFLRRIDVADLVAVLADPAIVNVSLLRQPWYDDEIAAGGLMRTHPERFAPARVRGIDVVLHREYFGHNPGLYRRAYARQMAGYGEYSYRDLLLREDPARRFAILGRLGDRHRVLHIGERKTGGPVYDRGTGVTCERLALFLFHRAWELCADRVRRLRRLNPGMAVHGLFGGSLDDLPAARAGLESELDGLYVLAERDGRWKKTHTDLWVRSWYRDLGHRLSFDVAHVVQWDLLYFDGLAAVYRDVPAEALGLTGLVPLATVADRWDWTASEPLRRGSLELLEIAQRRFGYRGTPQVCLGPGYCLPREFLDAYSAAEPSEAGHDELRLPLFAQLLGFTSCDNGLYPRWFDPRVDALFNADNAEVDPEAVRREVADPWGRRAFHPCREAFPPYRLAAMAAADGPVAAAPDGIVASDAIER